MPAYQVTISYITTAGKASSWSGRKNGADKETAVSAAATQIHARASVQTITGVTAVELK